jgi:hypothetical protein
MLDGILMRMFFAIIAAASSVGGGYIYTFTQFPLNVSGENFSWPPQRFMMKMMMDSKRAKI